MINARQDAAPEHQEPIQANQVYRGRLPSIGALYGRQRECAAPTRTATPIHRAGWRGLPIVLVSQRDNFARHDGDLLAVGAADVLVLADQRTVAAQVT